MNVSKEKDKLVRIVQSTLARYQMIRPGSVVVVGVSGGPDSVALLHVLHRLSAGMDFGIIAAHLDHGLRQESVQDAAFVRDLTTDLGLRLVMESSNVAERAASLGLSVEETGRRERYAFFERVRAACGAASIATAHHRDDVLETFFLRILRGSSLQGLTGIPAKRRHIVRPLIDATRTHILDFLCEHDLPFRIDRTNLDSDTDRNYVRNRVFPVLEERFPHFRAPLTRTMAMIRDEDAHVGQEAAKLFRKSVVPHPEGLLLDLTCLKDQPTVLQARVVLLALYELSGPHVRWARSHVAAILNLATAGPPSGEVHMPGGLTVSREYDRLILTAAAPDTVPGHRALIVEGPGLVPVPGADVTFSFCISSAAPGLFIRVPEANRVYFDADLVPFPLVLRTFMPGDRFRPWGMTGSRKVKKTLIDAKIPLRMRRVWPLLVKGDQILWIPRVRRSALAAVGPGTRKVLEVAVMDGHAIAADDGGKAS